MSVVKSRLVQCECVLSQAETSNIFAPRHIENLACLCFSVFVSILVFRTLLGLIKRLHKLNSSYHNNSI